jgi:valyl-tRNA synthetase
VNFEAWPTPDGKLRNEALEQEFDTLLQAVSLVYSARQKAQLKRRWPLQEAKIVAPKKVQKALKNLEEAFLELGNVKTVKYLEELPEIDTKRWVSASNEAGAVHILLYTHRGKALLGEGLLRDLSRRIQALRKELGFMPTDILGEVHIAKLDPENTALLKPYLSEMADLVRAKKVYVHAKQSEFEYEWHKLSLDKKEVNVAIIA